MFGSLRTVDLEKRELNFEGYVKGNLLNVRRLIHITGLNPQAFKVKRIEIAKDPCPVKVSQKEKEKILSTSKAQSLMSSRMSSRRMSLDSSRAGTAGSGTHHDTTNRVIQVLGKESEEERDQEQCENKPSLFAAEQTWPTEEEMKEAQRRRRVSEEEGEQMDTINTESSKVGGFHEAGKKDKTLEEMFERMEIKVVGRENEDQKSDDDLPEDEEEDDEFDLNKTFMEDPNKIS
jgi:hypothetical protein